jgi:vitamin B12 transporter
MNRISSRGRVLSLVLVLGGIVSPPSFLWADPLLPESTGNSLTVESQANTPSAQFGVAMPEVVVSTNRLDTPLSQVANSMSVITAKDIEQKQASTALDALQGVPGLTLLENGASGENSSLFIRGADAGHSLVLVDGIPMNNPISTDRSFTDFDQYFLEDVSQIEVVRGPMSTVYGTNATAGVVNIITQRGDGPPKGSLLLEGGAYDTFRESATASAGDKSVNYSLSASRYETDGFPSADKALGNTLNDSDENTTASFRLGILPSSDLDNHVYVRYIQSRTNLPSQGGANGDDPNYFVNERQWVVGSQSNWKLLDGQWEQVLGMSYTNDLQVYTDDFSSYANSHYERGALEGQSAQINWQNNINLWKGETLAAGIQEQEEWGREDDTADFGYGLSDTLIDRTTTTGSYFIESQTALLDRLFATLGGRLDAVSSFGSQYTYRGAVAYFVPGLETKLKATYGTGFTAPSIYQLYSPYGSASLRAETSEGWDAGFEQPFLGGAIKAGATYFHNDYTNLIDYENTATPPYGEYFNIGKARTEGWETFASAKPITDLEIRADYTYTWAFDEQTGNALLRRPQNQADFSASYQWRGAHIGFNILYVGDRPDEAFLNYTSTPVTLPSYTLVNLMAAYDINANLKLFGRVDNLFNTVYEEVYGYGTPGISAYAGTKVSF